MFNFLYTNIFNIYFVILIILTILKVFKNYNLQMIILLLMGIVFYIIRFFLENDAMIRAEYLSLDYMQKYNKEKNICSNEEIEEVISEYKKLNKYGIKMYNLMLFFKAISKFLIYDIICQFCDFIYLYNKILFNNKFPFFLFFFIFFFYFYI